MTATRTGPSRTAAFYAPIAADLEEAERVLAVVDEIACAAELVMGKTSGIPVAVVRGVDTSWFRGNSSMITGKGTCSRRSATSARCSRAAARRSPPCSSLATTREPPSSGPRRSRIRRCR